MSSTQNPNRLQKQLVHLIALEAAIEQKLEELIPLVSEHDQARALLAGFQSLPREQRQALEERLDFLTQNAPAKTNPVTISVAGSLGEEEEYPVSAALQSAYTMFNQAVIGYSVLHPLATRFLDSPWIADEGTTYHLTRQHTQNYVQAIQQISRLLHDIVLWELDQDGRECQCICPACGVGICLCSMAGRGFLSQVWEEAGPIFDDEGIYVQLPKQNSAAENTGLEEGDVILAVGEQEIESGGTLQSAVRNAEPDEDIHLTVRRRSNEIAEVVIKS